MFQQQAENSALRHQSCLLLTPTPAQEESPEQHRTLGGERHSGSDWFLETAWVWEHKVGERNKGTQTKCRGTLSHDPLQAQLGIKCEMMKLKF